MHVDAAYGCGLLVSPKFRHLLAGIESADSVTVDYHKSFLQPVSCSAFLVRDKHYLAVVTHHAEYLNPLSQANEGTPNLVNKSIQTTKRFDALKLWLTLRTMGADQLGAAFDRNIHLAKQTYLLLSEQSIEIIHQPQLSTLVFRYRPSRQRPEHDIDRVNAYIRKALFRSGEAVIAGTKVQGKQYLKRTGYELQPSQRRLGAGNRLQLSVAGVYRRHRVAHSAGSARPVRGQQKLQYRP
jgi:L-2,4-diaminobutyrate decarboxylase